MVASFAANSALASSGTPAVVAKAKCKKGKHKHRKKCKRRRPAPVVLPGPLVRATLSWSTPGARVDLDLHAFDAEGHHSGLTSTRPFQVEQGVPNALHSGDVSIAGRETFTDNIFVQGGPSNREFSYAVCFYDAATATFTGVTRSGQTSSVPLSGAAGDVFNVTTPGGPLVPRDPCV
jgi:hypothetical protein